MMPKNNRHFFLHVYKYKNYILNDKQILNKTTNKKQAILQQMSTGYYGNLFQPNLIIKLDQQIC